MGHAVGTQTSTRGAEWYTGPNEILLLLARGLTSILESPMIDFTELPTDGTRFEQLIRELLLVAGLSPHWTGKGADQGRDIVAEESATGPLGSFRRTWLVQCKHNAHSGKSVSISDIPSVTDDCTQASADGYLLACSTHPSAGVAQKLHEIAGDLSNRLVTTIWDSVDIERRLREPRAFGLAQSFFPMSMRGTPWSVYNMGAPSKWAAHYKGYFIYLNSRISSHFPSLAEVEAIVGKLESIPPQAAHEVVRPRGVYFDEKHEHFHVFADYLVPERKSPSLSPSDFEAILRDGAGLHSDSGAERYLTFWDVRLVRTMPFSDRYQEDGSEYYEPHMPKFEVGEARGPTIGELAGLGVWL